MEDIGSIEIHGTLPQPKKEKTINNTSLFTTISNFLTGKNQNLKDNNKNNETNMFNDLLKKENKKNNFSKNTDVVIDIKEETQSLLNNDNNNTEDDGINVEIVDNILE